MKKSIGKDARFFLSVYSVLMLAYPREFRREYGPQMVHLLLDCQRDARSRVALIGLWIRTLTDLVRTVPVEHLQNTRKENGFMSKLRTDPVAIAGCVLLIVNFLFLLNYGRSHQISSILLFGHVLDALVVTGVTGNIIAFLLIKLTALKPLRVAFWTFLIVSGVPALALVLIAGRVDPNFNATSVVIGYVVSFVFWYGLHWLWAHKPKPPETT